MVPPDPPEAVSVAFSQIAPPPVTVTADGDELTVRVLELTTEPPEVTTEIVPVVPEPAVAVIDVEELAVTVAAVPPTVTDVGLLKFVPVIVKDAPSQTEVGEKLDIVGLGFVYVTEI
jgi:hypothetical protein